MNFASANDSGSENGWGPGYVSLHGFRLAPTSKSFQILNVEWKCHKRFEILLLTYIRDKSQSFGLHQSQCNATMELVYVFFAKYDSKVGNAFVILAIASFFPLHFIIEFIYLR